MVPHKEAYGPLPGGLWSPTKRRPVPHQQVGLRDPGAPLARNLVAPRYVDDVDDVVCQLAAEIGSKIVCQAIPGNQRMAPSAIVSSLRQPYKPLPERAHLPKALVPRAMAKTANPTW